MDHRSTQPRSAVSLQRHSDVHHICPGGRCQGKPHSARERTICFTALAYGASEQIGASVVVGQRAHALRAVKHFARLEVGSVEMAMSYTAHQQVPFTGCYANAHRWAN
jgi:hypothetical protein